MAVERKSWQQHASPLARIGLLFYLLLVVYGSLYPFQGWADKGVPLLAWATAPRPRYITFFDIWTNIVGYMPLGGLLLLAVHPVCRGWRAVWLALLMGASVSMSMEALQTWLPNRVASNLDWATNAAGTFLGAVLVKPYAAALLDRGYLRQWRHAWFERHASFGLALVLLWPWAQLFPQAWLFGGGDVVRQWPLLTLPLVEDNLRGALPDMAGFRDTLQLYAAQMREQTLWEAAVTSSAWLGAGLMVSVMMRPQAPQRRLIWSLLIATLLLKAGAMGLQFAGAHAWSWLTVGAWLGLLIGSLCLWLVLWLPRSLRLILALVALSCAVMLTNLLPPNPYHLAILEGWQQGRFVHFNGLAKWLGWSWPYLALAYLIWVGEQAQVRRYVRRRWKLGRRS